MDKFVYKELKETVYRKELKNGLTVILLPKKEYRTTYALFSTDYGSIDQLFIQEGEKNSSQFPPGVAHFLEHKLFETENGDVFDDFSRFGASANAFTGITKTAYLFSCTENVRENLDILLNFVQTPYFTEESVDREKEIIGQEIQMYEDQPEWIGMMGLLNNLYPNHPIQTDIAGTVDSIKNITADDLYKNHHAFYHPSNMQLVVAGNIDVYRTIKWIEANQAAKSFEAINKIQRIFPTDSEQIIVPFKSFKMDVVKSKVYMGIKGSRHTLRGQEALVYSLKMEFILKMLFGETSRTYLDLYNQQIIDDSFNYEHTIERQVDYLSISGDTTDPVEFTEIFKQLLLTAVHNPDFNEAHFELVKKRIIGQELQSLNSLDYIANQFADLTGTKETVFDIIYLIEQIELQEIVQLASQYLLEQRLSVFHILPDLDAEKSK
ncbi:EF-P 5-aminopentanol modification-associated protein YfmH [Marinilactibacillus kalidii]|uniref:EF-P 5-aminopentanol modification-associated protein YfmH n=1 Tax=Marinilactibacillus kalidii TaxID=2820274 RepID=UPI001ABDE70C|nr:pitrilysin family protein [Marinilactibacillus kalidii]